MAARPTSRKKTKRMWAVQFFDYLDSKRWLNSPHHPRYGTRAEAEWHCPQTSAILDYRVVPVDVPLGVPDGKR